MVLSKILSKAVKKVIDKPKRKVKPLSTFKERQKHSMDMMARQKKAIKESEERIRKERQKIKDQKAQVNRKLIQGALQKGKSADRSKKNTQVRKRLKGK